MAATRGVTMVDLLAYLILEFKDTISLYEHIFYQVTIRLYRLSYFYDLMPSSVDSTCFFSKIFFGHDFNLGLW